MTQLSESVTRVIDQFAKLPGIGRKSAERLAYHVLRVNKAEALALADAIRDVRENVRYCSACYSLAESELCTICQDPKRDRTQLCIVEQPRDVIQLEQAGVFRIVESERLARLWGMKKNNQKMTYEKLSRAMR